jgi:hypothetical protein
MIDSREAKRFEEWMEDNYPRLFKEWELNYSEYLDLDEFVQKNNYIAWNKWIKNSNESN